MAEAVGVAGDDAVGVGIVGGSGEVARRVAGEEGAACAVGEAGAGVAQGISGGGDEEVAGDGDVCRAVRRDI